MSYDEIIERVRDKPEIWRYNHPLHKNREIHRRFWHQMATELQVSETLIKKRWKHLKDQYRKELKKSSKFNIPDDIVSWKYFDTLNFLKDDLKERDKDRLLSLVSREKERQDNDDDDDEEEEEEEENEEVSDDEKPLVKVRRAPKRLKKAKAPRCQDSQMLNIILKQLSDTKSMLEYKLNGLDESVALRNDPDYLFLMSLIPSMKQLTDIQKLQFKSKVNDFLLQEITNNTFGEEPITIKPEIEMADYGIQ